MLTADPCSAFILKHLALPYEEVTRLWKQVLSQHLLFFEENCSDQSGACNWRATPACVLWDEREAATCSQATGADSSRSLGGMRWKGRVLCLIRTVDGCSQSAFWTVVYTNAHQVLQSAHLKYLKYQSPVMKKFFHVSQYLANLLSCFLPSWSSLNCRQEKTVNLSIENGSISFLLWTDARF